MTELKDNRPHIEFDADKIQTWELMLLEGGKLNDMIMIFSRHLANGNGLISPDLPDAPLDELTKEQIQEIKASTAYKALRRYPVSKLKQVSKTFVDSMQGYDPN